MTPDNNPPSNKVTLHPRNLVASPRVGVWMIPEEGIYLNRHTPQLVDFDKLLPDSRVQIERALRAGQILEEGTEQYSKAQTLMAKTEKKRMRGAFKVEYEETNDTIEMIRSALQVERTEGVVDEE